MRRAENVVQQELKTKRQTPKKSTTDAWKTVSGSRLTEVQSCCNNKQFHEKQSWRNRVEIRCGSVSQSVSQIKAGGTFPTQTDKEAEINSTAEDDLTLIWAGLHRKIPTNKETQLVRLDWTHTGDVMETPAEAAGRGQHRDRYQVQIPGTDTRYQKCFSSGQQTPVMTAWCHLLGTLVWFTARGNNTSHTHCCWTPEQMIVG